MPFEKGQSGNPVGRKKGALNKTTATLKDMILNALDGVGGVQYLQSQADLNPTAFLTLVGKVLPMTVAGDPDNPLKAVTTVEIIGIPARESAD